jgi:surfeit locus 1 family protein
MTQTSLRFRPRWWAVLLAAAGCAAGIALGQWQAGRADAKRAAAAAHVPLQVRGVLLAQHTLFLQNRPHHGKPGYYVVQPLRRADGSHVLVLRGWSAVAALPPAPRGEVILEGAQRPDLPRVLEAGTVADAGYPARNVRQNISLREYASWSGLSLQPYVIEQHSALVVTQPPAPLDSLARDWPALRPSAEQHEAYALQWYSLAALSVLLLVFLSFEKSAT